MHVTKLVQNVKRGWVPHMTVYPYGVPAQAGTHIGQALLVPFAQHAYGNSTLPPTLEHTNV